jgi:hypothetical protein
VPLAIKKTPSTYKKKESENPRNEFEHVQFQVTKEKPFELNKQTSISLDINDLNEANAQVQVTEKKKRGRKPK